MRTYRCQTPASVVLCWVELSWVTWVCISTPMHRQRRHTYRGIQNGVLLSVMNAAARLVCSARKSDHITPLLPSVTFIACYKCHSGSSSDSLCSFSAACMAWLCALPCTWTVPCGRHGLSSSTSFRFDARAARSTDVSRHRRRPRHRSLRSSRLQRSAIWHHHVAIAFERRLNTLLFSRSFHLWQSDSCSQPAWHCRWFYFFLLLSALEVFLSTRHYNNIRL